MGGSTVDSLKNFFFCSFAETTGPVGRDTVHYSGEAKFSVH